PHGVAGAAPDLDPHIPLHRRVAHESRRERSGPDRGTLRRADGLPLHRALAAADDLLARLRGGIREGRGAQRRVHVLPQGALTMPLLLPVLVGILPALAFLVALM